MTAIERVQTGLRLEKGMLKVIRGLAEYMEISMAELTEGIILHALEGKPVPFDDVTLKKIAQLKDVYDMQFSAQDAHKLTEASDRGASNDV